MSQMLQAPMAQRMHYCFPVASIGRQYIICCHLLHLVQILVAMLVVFGTRSGCWYQRAPCTLGLHQFECDT